MPNIDWNKPIRFKCRVAGLTYIGLKELMGAIAKIEFVENGKIDYCWVFSNDGTQSRSTQSMYDIENFDMIDWTESLYFVGEEHKEKGIQYSFPISDKKTLIVFSRDQTCSLFGHVLVYTDTGEAVIDKHRESGYSVTNVAPKRTKMIVVYSLYWLYSDGGPTVSTFSEYDIAVAYKNTLLRKNMTVLGDVITQEFEVEV